MVANILPTDPGDGVGRSKKKSEHFHVAYQNKGNHETQQHGSKYFARRPPPRPWGWGLYVKIQLFQNIVMLHIKLKRITKRSNMVANVLPPGGH